MDLFDGDLSTDPLVGKDFEKEAVWLVRFNEVNPMDPTANGMRRTIDLGDHSRADNAVLFELLDLGNRQGGNQC